MSASGQSSAAALSFWVVWMRRNAISSSVLQNGQIRFGIAFYTDPACASRAHYVIDAHVTMVNFAIDPACASNIDPASTSRVHCDYAWLAGSLATSRLSEGRGGCLVRGTDHDADAAIQARL